MTTETALQDRVSAESRGQEKEVCADQHKQQRNIYPLSFFIFTFILACTKDNPTPIGSLIVSSAPSASEVVERFSDGCRGPDLFQGHQPIAAKTLSTHQWAKDRYDEGLEIQWNYEDAIEYPVMRQALDLVADTLYAMILPSKGINSLVVDVSIKDLGEDNEYTLGRAGG